MPDEGSLSSIIKILTAIAVILAAIATFLNDSTSFVERVFNFARNSWNKKRKNVRLDTQIEGDDKVNTLHIHSLRKKRKDIEDKIREKKIRLRFRKKNDILVMERAEITEQIGLQIQSNHSELPPAPATESFVGRQQISTTLRSLLESDIPAISVYGEGGFGKTTLVHKIVREALVPDGSFLAAAWTTAKLIDFRQGTFIDKEEQDQYFKDGYLIRNISETLEKIAIKLGHSEIKEVTSDSPQTELKRRVRALSRVLDEDSFIVVIDNLETHQDSDQVIDLIEPLFAGRKSKLLLTSRLNYNYSAQLLAEQEIPALSEAETAELFLHSATGAASKLIRTARPEQMVQLYEATMGVPLAINLAAAQVAEIGIGRTIEKFSEYSQRTYLDGESSPFAEYFRFVYEDIWKNLNWDAKRTLDALGSQPYESGAPYALLHKLVTAPRDKVRDLDRALSELKRYSLVRLTPDSRGQETYSMHPTVHRFVDSQAEIDR